MLVEVLNSSSSSATFSLSPSLSPLLLPLEFNPGCAGLQMPITIFIASEAQVQKQGNRKYPWT